MPTRLRTVLCEDGLEVERLVSRAYLERDASGRPSIEKEPAFAKDANAEVDRRVIQCDEIDRTSQNPFKVALDDESRRIER